MRQTMTVMALECAANLPGKQGTRKRLESLWGLYVIWRTRDSQPAAGVPVPERPTFGFLLLREIEATALAALRSYLPEEIPTEFVVALMKSTADATIRFMFANPCDASRYRRLGFEMFWSGLATMNCSGRKGIEGTEAKGSVKKACI